jgi:hypothetical protein
MSTDTTNVIILLAIIVMMVLIYRTFTTTKAAHPIPSGTQIAKYLVCLPAHALLIVGPYRSGKSCAAIAHAEVLANNDYGVLYIGPSDYCDTLRRKAPKALSLSLEQAVGRNAKAETVIIDLSFQIRDGQIYSYVPVSSDAQQWLASLGVNTRVVATMDDCYTQNALRR